MQTIPFAEKKPIFERLLSEAQYYNLSEAERYRYDDEIRNYVVYEGSLEFAREEAMAEGLAEGEARGLAKGKAEEKMETARNLKKLGVSLDIISQATGLSIKEIEAL